MKLNENFLVHSTGHDTIMAPTGKAGFSGVVRGGKTLGVMLEALKNDVTEEEIVAAMRARFDAPEGVIEADVAKSLEELRKIGAIDE